MHKRILSLLMALCLVFALLPFGAEAASETVRKGTLTYRIENGEATLTDCETYESGALTVPDTVNGCPVTAIGSYAFNGCKKLTEIFLPSTVTSIGDSAFSFCEALTGFEFPESVTSVGDGAFSYCKSLTAITIPEGAVSLGKELFEKCGSLRSVSLPSALIELGDRFFYGCDALEYVALPQSLTRIGDSAFYECAALTAVTLPEGVQSIGNSAFYKSALTEITIPGSVTTIGDNAFYSCDALRSVTVSEGVTAVGESAFAYCDALRTVTLPASVTSLGRSAFHSDSLTDLYYGGSYQDWTRLSAGVSDLLGKQTTVHCADDDSPLTWEIVDGTAKITGCDKSFSGALEIPETLGGCPVTEIGEKAFRGCAGITSVTIPGCVKTVGVSAFSGCSKLTALTLEEGVETIYAGAFENCDVRCLRLPATLAMLGRGAFSGNRNLPYVLDYSADCSDYGAFDSSTQVISMQGWCGERLEWGVCGSALHILGTGAMDNYEGATRGGQPWEYYMKSIGTVVLHEGVTGIGSYAFSAPELDLWRVTFPESLRSIGGHAFEGQTRLTTLELPDGLKTIGRSAFAGTGIEKLHIPEHVKELSPSAFADCKDLRAVWVPESVTKIGDGAFHGDAALTDVYYAGLKRQWNAVSIGSRNEPLTRATLHCRKAGTVAGFVDVSEGVYYADPVAWAAENGVTTGTSPDTFSPENVCTRAQVVTFLWRAAGSPEPNDVYYGGFVDVNYGTYYYKAVLWAVQQGITNGTSSSHFSPNDPCTRAHVVTFLWRAMGSPDMHAKNPFRDVPPRQYYSEAVLLAVGKGVTNGTSPNTFSPADYCTRGQIVTFLYRAMK